MNDNDIKKCIKNGKACRVNGKKIQVVTRASFTTMTAWWNVLHEVDMYATKAAAKLAIATRRQDERLALRKADADAEHDHFIRTWKGPLTDEAIDKLHHGDPVFLADCGGEVSEWAGGQLHKGLRHAYLDKAEAENAAHNLWLEVCKTQLTPITPEQAKLLRVGDSYWIEPAVRRDLLKAGFENTPEHIKSILEGSAFFTSKAAQAALDKAKAVVTKRNNDETAEEKLTHSVVLDKRFTSLINVLSSQVGGNHYLNKPIQPVLYCAVNGLDDDARAIIKYVTRHGEKGKHADLDKAIQYMLIMRAKCYPDAPECPYSVKNTAKEQK